MKALLVLLSLGTVSLLTFNGCGKKEPPPPAAYEISGVKIDIPRLQAAFAKTPALQPTLNSAISQLRYGKEAHRPRSFVRTCVLAYQAACLARNPAKAAFPERVASDMVSKKTLDWSTGLLLPATEISHRQGLGARPRFLIARL